jgi:beta-N-acetylhexosaminidase
MAACSQAQPQQPLQHTMVNLAARQLWVDSVYARLSDEERIGQLFMVAAYSGGPKANVAEIEQLVRARQIGGVIFMQGGPVRQAVLTNRYQGMAQVPLLISMDAEWGLGMRLDSVINLSHQMILGAPNDTALAYGLGQTIAAQCKRLGVHVNFAPVVDVNNNPANPVINARSFGEDKKRVTRLAIAYMRGMQDAGVMACAKHFPGHGDVSVDSHLDLPVINKSRAALDTLELYPFRELVRAGVQSVMVAHLAVPVLEREAHIPTTLSKNTVTGLLKNELRFNGLVFTDALNMQGVAKYFKPGEVDVRAFVAGNDVLLFSQDVPTAIAKIREAIATGRVTRKDLEGRVKKILAAKYDAGLNRFEPISTNNITADINQYTASHNAKVAEAALTVVRDRKGLLPLKSRKSLVYIGVGGGPSEEMNEYLRELSGSYSSTTVMKGSKDATPAAAEAMLGRVPHDVIIVGIHGLSFYPGKNYGMDDATLAFLSRMSKRPDVIAIVMGNAYALKYVCDAGTLVCGYEDTQWTRAALQKFFAGEIKAKGSLPVTPPCLK